MKRKGLIIGLAVALMMTGCSNSQKADVNKTESAVSVESENIVSQMTDKEVIEGTLELLGQTDESSKDFFGGSEVNMTSDGEYLIGRVYKINVFGENTELYTSYDENESVNSINFQLEGKNVEEYSAMITEILGEPSEVSDTPSEGGSIYTLWTVGEDQFFLYSNYDISSGDYITVQIIRPNLSSLDEVSEY